MRQVAGLSLAEGRPPKGKIVRWKTWLARIRDEGLERG
jgi:hypothetical protein